MAKKITSLAGLRKAAKDRIKELEPKTKSEFYKNHFKNLIGQGKEAETLRNLYIELLINIAKKLVIENQQFLKKINSFEAGLRERIAELEVKKQKYERTPFSALSIAVTEKLDELRRILEGAAAGEK
jgi:hypothetical protein